MASGRINYNRVQAAEERVRLLKAEQDIGTLTLDLVLRAQASLAEAEAAYFRQVVAYNKAITSLNVASGNLLETNGVWLAEGGWALRLTVTHDCEHLPEHTDWMIRTWKPLRRNLPSNVAPELSNEIRSRLARRTLHPKSCFRRHRPSRL